MHYEKANEKVPVAPIETSRLATNKDYRQNSDIRRTRTIVLVLLGIQFVKKKISVIRDQLSLIYIFI
jgi:hypothetical protein